MSNYGLRDLAQPLLRDLERFYLRKGCCQYLLTSDFFLFLNWNFIVKNPITYVHTSHTGVAAGDKGLGGTPRPWVSYGVLQEEHFFRDARHPCRPQMNRLGGPLSKADGDFQGGFLLNAQEQAEGTPGRGCCQERLWHSRMVTPASAAPVRSPCICPEEQI